MGPRGALGVGQGGPPPGRRGGQAGAEQPALEGAFARDGPVRVPPPEHHADQAGAPGGMLAPQS
jgi:hypothetical protein